MDNRFPNSSKTKILNITSKPFICYTIIFHSTNSNRRKEGGTRDIYIYIYIGSYREKDR